MVSISAPSCISGLRTFSAVRALFFVTGLLSPVDVNLAWESALRTPCESDGSTEKERPVAITPGEAQPIAGVD